MFILIFIYGLVLGSFYNVVIYRVPHGKSIVKPPSSCGRCGQRLKPLELVPVLSWLIQRGRCKHCGSKISIRYPLVELLTGFLFVVVYTVIGFRIELLRGLILVSLFIIISFIDLDHQIIPDGLNLLLGVIGFLYWLLVHPFPFIHGISGFFIGGGLLFIVALLGPMGGGDIKFMAAMGFWLGIGYTLMALLLSFIIGGVVSGGLLLTKVVNRKTPIPFGPFLCLGSLIVILYGSKIFVWYVNTIL